ADERAGRDAERARDALEDEAAARVVIASCIKDIDWQRDHRSDAEAAPHPGELIPRGRPGDGQADGGGGGDDEADEARERDGVVRRAPGAVAGAAPDLAADEGAPERARRDEQVRLRLGPEEVIKPEPRRAAHGGADHLGGGEPDEAPLFALLRGDV